MYERFFHLRERPFDLTPNPRYLYLTPRHREALGNLQYGIAGRKGITVLVGEAGTGKTTLVRAVIDMLGGPGVKCVYLNNPVLTRAEFYEFLAPKFGLSERASTSKAQFLAEAETALLAQHDGGGTTALIVDEAQSLPHELMEEVRLLANFETADEKLLQVVLAGQPELADRLEHEDLRQLKQRVALRCGLEALDLRETAAYISGRVAIAGGEAVRIFTRDAIQAVHRWSRGIPRTISVICDNALVTAFAAGISPVTAAVIADVCRDFRLPAPDGASHETPSTVARIEAPARVSEPPGGPLASPGNGHHAVANVVRMPTAAGERAAAAVSRLSDDAGQPPLAHVAEGHGHALFGIFTRRKRFRFF